MGCFAIRRGDARRKADVASHDPDFEDKLTRLRTGPYPIVELLNLVLPSGGIRYGTGSPPPYLPSSPETVPFIRATDIKEGEIQVANLLYVHRDQPPSMDKCRLRGREVIVVRSGVNTGDCAPVPNSLVGAFAAYDLIVELRRGDNETRAEYLSAFLDTRVGRAQINVLKARSAQPHINADELGSVLVSHPPVAAQDCLLRLLQSKRLARQEKLQEANDLLTGVDVFVLDQLGLALPVLPPRQTWAARIQDTKDRFDADYHSPKFRALREKLHQGRYLLVSVDEFCPNPVSGFAAGRADQEENPDDGVPHLRPLNITNTAEFTFNGTKYVPRDAVRSGDIIQRGEVLFNNTNSTAWVGKTVVFSSGVTCACSNHITRLRVKRDLVSPEYVSAVFNALRRVGYFGLLATNFNNQAGISVETLKGVRIPRPDPKVQNRISAEVARRRAEAERLRSEADALWQSAKNNFEHALLGPSRHGGT